LNNADEYLENLAEEGLESLDRLSDSQQKTRQPLAKIEEE
jgi:hypothetical protein